MIPEEKLAEARNNKKMQKRIIFVGGIPGGLGGSQVREYFGRKFGEVTGLDMPLKKSNPLVNYGFCFVIFKSPYSAIQALAHRNQILGDRRISCKPFVLGSLLNQQKKDMKSRKVFVRHIPDSMQDHEFKEFFSQFGKIEDFYIVRYFNDSPSSLRSKMPATPHTSGVKIPSSAVGYIVFSSHHVADKLVQSKQVRIGSAKMEIERYDTKFSRLRRCVLGESESEYFNRSNPSVRFKPNMIHFFKPNSSIYHQNASSRVGAKHLPPRSLQPTVQEPHENHRFNLATSVDKVGLAFSIFRPTRSDAQSLPPLPDKSH